MKDVERGVSFIPTPIHPKHRCFFNNQKKKKRMKGCDFPLINNGRASSFVLFRSAILNLGHCEEMTPLRL